MLLLPARCLTAPVAIAALALAGGTSFGRDLPVYKLVLQSHRFVPDHLTVPAGQRFILELANHDDTPDEFESSDMKFEKVVVNGGTVTAHAGPLQPGTYRFFDDYHPGATGTVTAAAAQ